ncbi:MAG: DNA polymerase IV [Deltaproteobacteria bacterium]|nr:DNA polymerase IV [Deltaproteobacteria bacterium]
MEKIIMHMDMDAFFASVEQLSEPKLRGKAIAVIGSSGRTVVTTASYEARAYGVKTGMNKYEAKLACQHLIFVVGNNQKYIAASEKIMELLTEFSPCVEPYSIDEAFIDITGVNLFGTPSELGQLVKDRILEETGLNSSVGIGPNKLISKLASGMKKPDGLFIIKKKDVLATLANVPVNKLWGIGPATTRRLEEMSIKTCEELAACPVSLLRSKFGIVGEKLALMARGEYTSRVVPSGEEEGVKSIGHSTTLRKNITDTETITDYILKLLEDVSIRARKHGLFGSTLSLTIRYASFKTFTRSKKLQAPTNDSSVLYHHALKILKAINLKEPVRLIGLSISKLTSASTQQNLFAGDTKREKLLNAMDEVNERFGTKTLSKARLFTKVEEKGVISPAWRPSGVRRIDVK